MTSSEGDFTTEEGRKLLKEIADFSKPVVLQKAVNLKTAV